MKLVFKNQRWYVEGPNSVIPLAVDIENIIENNLGMGNNYGSFLNDAGHYVMVSTNDQNDPRHEPFNVHFCFGVDLNPSTKEPCLFFFSVKDNSLVNKLIPILVSRLGENVVFDLDFQEFSKNTIQQIFEKR
jgi:hypothetical protein